MNIVWQDVRGIAGALAILIACGVVVGAVIPVVIHVLVPWWRWWGMLG